MQRSPAGTMCTRCHVTRLPSEADPAPSPLGVTVCTNCTAQQVPIACNDGYIRREPGGQCTGTLHPLWLKLRLCPREPCTGSRRVHPSFHVPPLNLSITSHRVTSGHILARHTCFVRYITPSRVTSNPHVSCHVVTCCRHRRVRGVPNDLPPAGAV